MVDGTFFFFFRERAKDGTFFYILKKKTPAVYNRNRIQSSEQHCQRNWRQHKNKYQYVRVNLHLHLIARNPCDWAEQFSLDSIKGYM